MILSKLQELLEIESGHGDYLAALRQSVVHQDLHAVNMKKWQKRQHCLSLVNSEDRCRLNQIGNTVAMGQHHAFRESGGPGRVRQNHHIIRGDLDLLRQRLAHQSSQRGSLTRIDGKDLLNACSLGRLPCDFEEHGNRYQQFRP